ncbi:hypothetical protein B0H14DRAFT_3457258 [Mycena olivaceomarginata]|nr:hypothetical protein B0H14DRAFT_3457258 [Mycena olivaceomarginata]
MSREREREHRRAANSRPYPNPTEIFQSKQQRVYGPISSQVDNTQQPEAGPSGTQSLEMADDTVGPEPSLDGSDDVNIEADFSDAAKRLDVHFYSRAGAFDIIDITTVQALVGRVKDVSNSWAIIDRSGVLARAQWANDGD